MTALVWKNSRSVVLYGLLVTAIVVAVFDVLFSNIQHFLATRGHRQVSVIIILHSLVFSLRGRVGKNQSPVM